jgi:C4-type Zn-finger protein
MDKKRHQIKASCPQCGCSAVSHLSDEEIKARYGDIPNVEMECSECMLKYTLTLQKKDGENNEIH